CYIITFIIFRQNNYLDSLKRQMDESPALAGLLSIISTVLTAGLIAPGAVEPALLHPVKL
ncbi:hypothetical protein, partial [Enterobacter hormaechei]|uniref:hypothetical protein n=1 Tax=Enterobacter hormaechei TaxID=158836 RepID=UPI00195C334B